MIDRNFYKYDNMTLEELLNIRKSLEFSMRNSIDSMFSYSSGREFRDEMEWREKELKYINSLIAKKTSRP